MDATGLDSVDVSVIVPVFNEEPRLEHNVQAILSQKDAPRFEIIYIDDCSTDRSWEKLVSFSARDNRIRVYRLEQWQSRGAVGRLGVTLARGSIIAVLGADCTIGPDWLRHSELLTDDVAVVGFPVFPPPDLEYLHWRFHFKGSGQVAGGNVPHGAGALIRKDILLKAGNFPDARVGADTKAFRAVQALGARVLLLPEPAVRLMEKRTTLKDHLKRHFERGRNAGSGSKKIYSIMIATMIVLLVSSLLLWSVSPLLSAVTLLAAFGPLANPSRVHYYVKTFERPGNVVARVVLFGGVKILETLSILAGYIVSVSRKERGRESVRPARLSTERF